MRIKTFSALTAVLLLAVGCQDDLKPELSAKGLSQTTWKGTGQVYYNDDGTASKTYTYILQFFTDSTGICISMNSSGVLHDHDNFTYHLNRRLMIFNGALNGIWTIMQSSPEQIIIRIYLPEKHTIILEKQY